MNMLFQIFTYTFAIFGIIVFIQETITFFTSQKFGKILLILEEEENVEQILKDYLRAVRNFKNTYLFYQGNNPVKEETINLFCEKNPYIIRINEQGCILHKNK